MDELYKLTRTKSQLKITVAEGFEDFTKEGVHHEAGFDAFMTGAAFLRLKDLYGQEVLDTNANQLRTRGSSWFRINLASQTKDVLVARVNIPNIFFLHETRLECLDGIEHLHSSYFPPLLF